MKLQLDAAPVLSAGRDRAAGRTDRRFSVVVSSP